MKIIHLSQGEPAWLAWRKQGVTASDAAVILNRSCYKTRWQLWAEKVGLITEADISANPWVIHGVKTEDIARQCFEAQREEIVWPLCVQSEQHPLMRASLDGLNDQGEPVELKCPSPKVWQAVCEQQTESPAYQLYSLQVQHQLLVTEAQQGWLVFYHDGQLQVFTINRDVRLQEQLLTDAATFWQHVMARKAPEKDPERDVFTPQGEQIAIWHAAALQYQQYETQITALKKQLKQCEIEQKPYLKQLQVMMGNYSHAQGNGVQITRYAVAGRVNYAKFITDKLGAVTADELVPFREASTERYRVTCSKGSNNAIRDNGVSLTQSAHALAAH